MKKMTKYLIIFFSLSSLLEKPNKGLKNNNSHVRKQNTSWQKKKIKIKRGLSLKYTWRNLIGGF